MFVILIITFEIIFAEDAIVYTTIYTIGGDPVIWKIVDTELTTESQLNDANESMIKNFKDHPKYQETPIIPCFDHINSDADQLSDKYPGIKHYLLLITDYLTNLIRQDLLKSNDAKALFF
ncbi:hypothetical protein [Treponema sp. R80B11-R83G3]